MDININHINKEELKRILKPHNTKGKLVMVCIRANNRKVNRFDDVALLVHNNEVLFKTTCTLDPGLPMIKQPVNPEGAAIVANGYWNGLWRIGLHQGKYLALVQNRPVLVFRDNNRDSIVDFDKDYVVNDDLLEFIQSCSNNATKIKDANNKVYKVQYGMFGINFHRASIYKKLLEVGVYSAGCAVVQDAKDYFKLLDYIQDFSNTLMLKSVDALYINEHSIY